MQLTQPGIGLSLEMSYGYSTSDLNNAAENLMNGRTAAIRWHNGTVQSVAQVKGSPPYIELMKQLAYTTPDSRFPHDIPTTDGKVYYMIKRLQRIINKLLGRPANSQTSIIAAMVDELKTAVESASGERVTHALVTSPDSIRLTTEEVGDALDYLKIQNVMKDPDEL